MEEMKIFPGEAYIHPVIAKIRDSYDLVINKGSLR